MDEPDWSKDGPQTVENYVWNNEKSRTITFECDRVNVRDNSLEIKWLVGVMLNFENYDELVFSLKDKKYTFKKVQ